MIPERWEAKEVNSTVTPSLLAPVSASGRETWWSPVDSVSRERAENSEPAQLKSSGQNTRKGENTTGKKAWGSSEEP